MHFRDSHKRNVSCTHDRSSQTFRERSRKRYADEKKEREHELHDNQNDILKAMNDHYEHLRTNRDHVSMQLNSETQKIIVFVILDLNTKITTKNLETYGKDHNHKNKRKAIGFPSFMFVKNKTSVYLFMRIKS